MNQINKIQEYLRLNHPTLWNLKIVHALVVGLLCNLVMFWFGYTETSISLNMDDADYRYTDYETPSVLYFFAFILSVLSLISWLVFYFRNNRVKRFYPIRSKGLYVEWLLSFIIVSMFCLYLFSVYQGSQTKKRSYMSEQKMEEGLNLLYRVSVLNPNEAGYIEQTRRSSGTPSRDGSLLKNTGDFQDKDRVYLSVRTMLINNDSVAIKALMSEYLLLLKEYESQSLPTVESWMSVVYNPPQYFIDRGSRDVDRLSKRLKIANLKNYYQYIQEGYDNSSISWSLLTSLFFGLSISATILACRLTSGRSWLISLVVHFVVMLVTALFSIGIGVVGYMFLWLFIYAGYLIYVYSFTRGNGYKGKTPILMSLIITYSSVLLLFIYGTFYMFAESLIQYDYGRGDSYRQNDGLYNFLNEWNSCFMWAALVLTIPLMYFVTRYSLKWKAYPEE